MKKYQDYRIDNQQIIYSIHLLYCSRMNSLLHTVLFHWSAPNNVLNLFYLPELLRKKYYDQYLPNYSCMSITFI